MKMNAIQYYRISWLFPVILPMAAIVLESLLHQLGLLMPDVIGMGIGVAFSAVFMFFIPYAALVGAYLLLLYNRHKRIYTVAIVLAPVLMALFVSLFIQIVGSGSHDVFGMSLFYARYCFVIGYFYVALIFLLLWILLRARVVAEE